MVNDDGMSSTWKHTSNIFPSMMRGISVSPCPCLMVLSKALMSHDLGQRLCVGIESDSSVVEVYMFNADPLSTRIKGIHISWCRAEMYNA